MTKNYIPTIDISSLIKNNFDTQVASKTIKEIEKACVNVGFFQVTGHGLNLKEIKKFISNLTDFVNFLQIDSMLCNLKKSNINTSFFNFFNCFKCTLGFKIIFN